MRLVLRGGQLLDPATKRDAPGEVLIVDGEIAAVAPKVDATGARVIDVSGGVIAPGFVDLHSVLTDERDVDAALRGGFTTVVTVPASDSISSDRLRVIKAAPLTRNLAGDELGETDSGSPVLSQGFAPISRAGVMRRALRYSAGFDTLLMVHAEDKSLSGPGVIGFGLTATRLGLLGVPESAETSVVARDLLILEETGGRLHFSHLTTARAVELVADAKRRGLKVSCDVTPHHLTRDTRAAEGYSLDARVWPPLRNERDVAALRQGLRDGAIDALACDHVRVDVLDREHPFESCAPGCEAFEQALPAAKAAGLSLSRAVEVLATAPARLLGLKAGLTPGVAAAITVIDSSTWSVRGSIIGARHTFPAGVVT